MRATLTLALAAAVVTGAARAETPLFPAAQCAAFWLGRDDYAGWSAFLDRDPSDPVRAAAFRAAAVRLNGGDAGPVDAFITKERQAIELLFKSFIADGNEQSLEVHDLLLETCERFARTAPETRNLP